MPLNPLLIVLGIALVGSPAPRVPTDSTWWPAVGTVVLSGGGLSGATNEMFIQRMIALAGGPGANIVVIPTANPRADTAALRRVFEAHGALHVAFVHATNHAAANSPESVEPLRTANAVFLTGGQSMVLERAYLGTLVEREIENVLARGGVLIGDSAGAIAIGCAWLTWLPDPFGKRGEEFCALPRVAVSPHANVARGFVVDDEVLGYLRAHRGMVGIDIDENTVLVLRGGNAEVFGDGHVSFIDPDKSSSSPFLILRSGQSATLK